MTIRVGRGREIVFNPVPYETIKVWASITEEVDVLPDFNSKAWQKVCEGYDEILTDLLEPECLAAAEVTANRKSIVHDYRIVEDDSTTTDPTEGK